jgi:PKD repeat protein
MKLKRMLCTAIALGALTAGVAASPASAALAINATQAGSLTMQFTAGSIAGATWSWSFGDGFSSSEESPSHAYMLAGTYQVTATATASDGTTVLDTGTASVHVYAAPTANFSYIVLANGTVQFTDASGGEPQTWQWTFPSGTFTGQSPPAQVIPAGTSQVTLAVTNPAGPSTVTLPVVVNGPPVAKFTISSNPAGTSTPVTFDASGSTDPNADALSYSWDLNGDQTYGDATGPVQSESFPTAGTYRIGVRVSDGHGGTDTAVDFVTVLPDKAPTVSMTANPARPAVGQPVTFTANAADADGTVSAIQWDLDDDGAFDNGVGPSVNWTFTTPGSRIVAVRATDDMGVTAIAFQTIDVTGSATGSSTASTQPGSAPLSSPQDAASSSRRLITPFPIVRIRGLIQRRSVRISLLSVVAPKGTTVKVLCSGRSCAKKSVKRKMASGRTAARFSSLERRMRNGTFIRVYVTAPHLYGKYTSFTIRANAAPSRRDRCLKPGHTKPVVCPVQ